MTDTEVLALTLYGEARGEPIESKVGVACVIRNRAAHSQRSISAICLAPHQFSCWTEERDQMAAAQASLPNPDPVLAECLFLASGIVGGQLRDNTHGANHYYATSIAAPKWAVNQPVLAHLGHHLFFNVA